ncbi:MAG: CDP-alcohol phosphatidyltransferase family protein [Bacteroidota bacterium]|nr:CDP-alcohol phosphatidyltransferase family protein [Bacteroidota bacterium]
MNIKKNIPNAITCGNLLCGCLAIVKCFEGDLVWAAYLVGIAAVLDFFDGFAARLLKVSSPIGKDLDSLADMVTFGVVPGMVMFQMIKHSMEITYLSDIYIGFENKTFSDWAYISFLIPIFSAIRLAKFNNDTRQSDSFIGLPTPANAIFICSIPLFIKTDLSFNQCFGSPVLQDYIFNKYVLCLVSCLMSLLLIANLPLIALKFKNFTWTDNKIRFIFLGLSVALLVAFQFVGIPLVIILYILVSIVNNIFFKKKV